MFSLINVIIMDKSLYDSVSTVLVHNDTSTCFENYWFIFVLACNDHI